MRSWRMCSKASPMWRDTQRAFAASLRNPGLPVPGTLSRTNGEASQRRFDVYRNNVAVGLMDAIADTYPVVRALVGDEFWAGLARNFTRLFLPSSPVLLDYGVDFADFISTQDDTATVPYLAHVAALEWAWNRAYHAADMAPIDIDILAAVPEDAVENIRLQFHPSGQLLQSPWPVASIWHAHQHQDPHSALGRIPGGGEQAIIVRPDGAVEVRALDPTAFNFTKALFDGQSLGQASPLVMGSGSLDLAGHLAALFETGAIVGIGR